MLVLQLATNTGARQSVLDYPHSVQTIPNHETVLSSLIEDSVLDSAWEWLCKPRKDYPASSDIWWLRQEVFYIRIMDDWNVLAKIWRHLQRVVTITNQTLSQLKLEKHPDKTFIGLIQKGFDFLGYHFSQKGLRVAQTTFNIFFTKVTRLYEQSP